MQVRAGDFVAPETARPGLNPEIYRVMRKAMAKAPADRYQQAGDMLVDVEQVMRVAFRAVGQTELARWLSDLSAKDGVPPLTRAQPPAILRHRRDGSAAGDDRGARISAPPPMPGRPRPARAAARTSGTESGVELDIDGATPRWSRRRHAIRRRHLRRRRRPRGGGAGGSRRSTSRRCARFRSGRWRRSASARRARAPSRCCWRSRSRPAGRALARAGDARVVGAGATPRSDGAANPDASGSSDPRSRAHRQCAGRNAARRRDRAAATDAARRDDRADGGDRSRRARARTELAAATTPARPAPEAGGKDERRRTRPGTDENADDDDDDKEARDANREGAAKKPQISVAIKSDPDGTQVSTRHRTYGVTPISAQAAAGLLRADLHEGGVSPDDEDRAGRQLHALGPRVAEARPRAPPHQRRPPRRRRPNQRKAGGSVTSRAELALRRLRQSSRAARCRPSGTVGGAAHRCRRSSAVPRSSTGGRGPGERARQIEEKRFGVGRFGFEHWASAPSSPIPFLGSERIDNRVDPNSAPASTSPPPRSPSTRPAAGALFLTRRAHFSRPSNTKPVPAR